jgi:DNA-binding transcriptional MerR regulator
MRILIKGAQVIQVLSIGDLERVSGVPRTTIHYYLRQGLLPRPQKAAASRSLYTEEHVEILREIDKLKQAGLSIAEIEGRLQQRVGRANEVTIDLAAQEYDRLHNRILALGVREFAAKGYKRTHVTSMMRQLGITATVFYGHFASKRRLLAECVSVLMKWSLAYADEKTASLDDPAERLIWEAFAHSRVFELGTAAFAVIRVEGTQDDADLRKSIEDGLAGTVARITKELPAPTSSTGKRPIRDELIALSLLGAWEQTAFDATSRTKYSRRDVLRAHLWLFLATQAALRGEVDIDSRLAQYEPLISKLASQLPPLPPILELESYGSVTSTVKA